MIVAINGEAHRFQASILKGGVWNRSSPKKLPKCLNPNKRGCKNVLIGILYTILVIFTW